MNMLIRIIPANHSVTKHSHISRVASSQTAHSLDTPTPPLHHNDIIAENFAAHIIGNYYFGNPKLPEKRNRNLRTLTFLGIILLPELQTLPAEQ